MGVERTHDVPDDAGRFTIGAIPVVAAFFHGIQDTTMNGLQAIAHVGQSAADDDAHRVIHVAAAHFIDQANRRTVRAGHDDLRSCRRRCASGVRLLGIGINDAWIVVVRIAHSFILFSG